MKIIAPKKRKNRGETLVESLVGMLIIVMVFISLSVVVVTVARVNSALANDSAAFELPEAEVASGTVAIKVDGVQAEQSVAVVTKTDKYGRYHYYDVQ